MIRSRLTLLASVSILALSASAPGVFAADLPRAYSKAPPAVIQDTWSLWVEGGLQYVTGRDPDVNGSVNLAGPGFSTASRVGWNGAVGFDYRFGGTPWHVSGQFRYGENKKSSFAGNSIAAFNIPTSSGSNFVRRNIAGNTAAERKEKNWLADFMVGRDLGLGGGNAQLKFGARIAEIRGTTTGSAIFNVPNNTSSTSPPFPSRQFSFQQQNRFLGAGPRVALEGNVPLGGAWSVEYMGGVAGLYGLSSVNQIVAVPGGPVCLSGCPIAISSSSNGFVFNADAMLGISYALFQNAKLTASYRIDGYWDALRVIGPGNSVTTVDRIYHGPQLRLTVKY